MSFARVFAAVAICVIAIRSEFVKKEEEEDTETAIRYLQRYGYLNETMQTLSSLMDQRAFHHALALFQEYYRLPGNGTLTPETLKRMQKPRCGLRDLSGLGTSAIIKKWPKKRLTWNFHLATTAALDTTRAAFALWQANSSLSFERDPINPNILISWRTGRHINVDPRNGESCVSALDGPGGVLAHAALPTGHADFTSEVHVDQTEPWHILVDKNPRDKYYLLHTLTHEIGHSLGLSHSQRKDSVMYAYAPNEAYPVELSREDVFNIQNLYGVKQQDDSPTTTTTTTTTTSTPTTPRNVPTDLCALRRVDAILLLDSQMYIAHEKNVWSVDLNGKTYGEPLSLSAYMKFLPSNFTRISAAYQTPTGQLVLFVNNMIYVIEYPDFSLKATWPRSLSDFGLPSNARINAAVNTNTGRSYILYNDYAVGEIDNCVMKVVKHFPIQTIFPGIPPGVTSAFRYIDGNLYFVAERQFYKFNEFTRSVTSAGEFDLRIVDVTCPRDGLLQQLRNLLDRVVRIKGAFADDN